MIRFLTAGESHGKALTTIVEGFPSNLKIDIDFLNLQMKRRQSGYGRGLRMKIETDTAEILSGVRFGKTLGSPVSMLIKNKDWDNWLDKMRIESKSAGIEKSSARETAARVAAASIARIFLAQFGISIGSFVESIGGVYPDNNFAENLFNNDLPKNFVGWNLSEKADKSDVRVLELKQEKKIIDKIKLAKKKGDTLGGTFYAVATGVPVGLGTFVHYDKKLDAEIAQSIMSINAVKAVSVGTGFQSAEKFGSESHDEIILKNGILTRKTNRAGGIEGGISTGLPIIVRGAMKPIATLMSPIESVELKTMRKIDARRERSDFVAVPACAVISESMLAWTLAEFFIVKFGGDSIEETKDNFNNYTKKLQARIKKNFSK